MLSTLKIKLKSLPEEKLSYQVSSLLHGFLMTNIDYEYAEYLHQSNLKPYSQHLEFYNDERVWIITTLNKQAYEYIIKPLLDETINSVYLENRDLHIPIVSKEVSHKSYDELMDETFFANCSRYLSLKFITPTAFKSEGEYMFYPTIRHIFNSFIKKYDASNDSSKIYTPELIADIENYVKLSKYSLKSTYFSLEGVKVPAFVGEITLKINGPQQLVNLVHLLARYGEYSGVGIKTAIGMGSVKVIERNYKNARKTV